MKRIIFILCLVVLMGCNSGGGGDDGNENIDSNVFEAAYRILNTFIDPTETHSTGISTNGYSRSSGCSEGGGIDRSELTAFTKSETAYSLCGTQENEFENPLCIYPGQDAYRTLEMSVDFEHPDAEQEIIVIKLDSGEVEFTHTRENSNYEFEYGAGNANNGCIPENTFDFNEADIEGTYDFLIVSIDENGVPITRLTGSLFCDSNECLGTILITDLYYDSASESWLGKMEFEGLQYDMIATLSPDKRIAFFVGFLDPHETQNIPSSCIFVGASK